MQTKTATILGMCLIISAFLLTPSTSSPYSSINPPATEKNNFNIVINPVVTEEKVSEKSPVNNARNSNTEVECLAKVIFYEARDQSDTGKFAVADLAINRATNPEFPKSICGVIRQKGQFVWRSQHRHKEPEEWVEAKLIAKRAINNPNSVLPKSALYFHADSIRTPKWARKLKRIKHIDDHIFYAGKSTSHL